MAGVQIPTLDRTAPEALPTVGRIDTQSASAAQGDAAIESETKQAGTQVIKAANAAEFQAADTEATRRATAYKRDMYNILYGDPGMPSTGEGDPGIPPTPGIVHSGTNPVKLYSDFNTQLNDKMLAYQGGDDSGLSPMTQNLVNKKLAAAFNDVKDKSILAYGNQYQQFQQSVTADAVEQAKQEGMYNTQGIDPMAPIDASGLNHTLAPFQGSVDNIKDLIISHAVSSGGARIDPNGNTMWIDPTSGKPVRIDLGPEAEMNLKKNVSDMVSLSTKNLIDNGNLPQAQLLMDTYKDQIEPMAKNQLDKQYEAADISAKAYSAVGKVEDMHPDKALPILKSMDTSTPKAIEAQQKALEYYYNNQRYKEALQEKQSTDNYNILANSILARSRQDVDPNNPNSGPFASSSDFENSKLAKQLLPTVTNEKQKAALFAAIDKPKESDPQAKAAMYQMVQDNKLYGMPAEKMMMQMADLNPADQRTAWGLWTHANSDSEGADRSRLSFATSELAKIAAHKGLVHLNQYGKPDNDDDAAILGNLQDSAAQEVPKWQKGMSTTEISNWAAKQVADQINARDKANSGGWSDQLMNSLKTGVPELFNLFGGSKPPATASPSVHVTQPGDSAPVQQTPSIKSAPVPSSKTGTPDNALGNPSDAELMKMRSDFKAANGGKSPKSANELLQWAKGQKKQ